MMDYLVAVDGSESSMDAIEHAVSLITQTGGSLLIVHAVEARVLVDDAESVGVAPTNTEVGERIYTEDITDAESRGKSVLADAEEKIDVDDDIDIETTLLYGDPVECISSHATEVAVDGIIVGHRSLSGRVEGLVGSVAKGLVERASVPVTVVK